MAEEVKPKIKKETKKVPVKAKKGSEAKLKELKIELLKSPTKKKRIKKEIARILTELKAQTKPEESK
jgi:ribosomal protein L29